MEAVVVAPEDLGLAQHCQYLLVHTQLLLEQVVLAELITKDLMVQILCFLPSLLTAAAVVVEELRHLTF